MKAPRLIINADDFGLSRGISAAVFAAHRHGVLTNASMMANQPASEYAIEILAQMPHLGVGVHLNLCEGRPILPPGRVPTLVRPSGEFLSRDDLFRKLWRFQVSCDEIESEFRAQIRWLKERGVTPTHADSHLHVHLYPAALLPFARAVASEGIQAIRSPRCTMWPANNQLGGPHEGHVVRRVLVKSYRAALQFSALRQFVMPHSRVSFRSADRSDNTKIRESWIAAVRNLPPDVFELTCHPGLFDADFSASDRIAAQREKELTWLIDPTLREAIVRSGVHLLRYADILCNSGEEHRVAEVSAA
jgi:predicted glycoside hydrolase/deacetylase ChbG (UPF0249 family)